jgi:hypothetical protein
MYMAVWALVALIMGSDYGDSSGYHGMGVFLLVISILGTTYPFLTGIGAAVLTRFGFRPYVSRSETQTTVDQAAPEPAPPPIPQGPQRTGRPPTPPDGGPTLPRPPEEGRSDPGAK